MPGTAVRARGGDLGAEGRTEQHTGEQGKALESRTCLTVPRFVCSCYRVSPRNPQPGCTQTF